MGWMTKYPPHPAANAFPMIEGDWMEDLIEDIKANGIREPVSLWRDPRSGRTLTLDGRNRFQAAELGGLALMQVPVRWVETDDPFGFVMSANVLRRHLSVKQRREAAAELIALDPTRSDRQVAKATGVSHPTVGKVRRELEESGDAERVTARTDTLGRVQPVPEPSRTYPDAPQTESADEEAGGVEAYHGGRRLANGNEWSPESDIGAAVRYLTPRNRPSFDSSRSRANTELQELIADCVIDAEGDGLTAEDVRWAARFLNLVADQMEQ